MLVKLLIVLLVALCAEARLSPEADTGVREVFPGVGEYYYNGIPGNWSTAFRQCQASGGYLAVINSLSEADALREILTNHAATSVFIGFHDQFVEGVFTYINGRDVPPTTSSDNLWVPGYPGGSPNSNCGLFRAEGIFDDDCSLESPFICELSEDQGGEDNNDGFILLDGFGHYKAHEEMLSWPNAWQTCREERANLLVLDSEAEIEALWNAFDKFTWFIWLGVHRRWGPDDGFVSVNNTPLSQLGFQKWYSLVEPEGNFKTYPYLGTYSTFGMAAERVDVRTAFFCERPL